VVAAIHIWYQKAPELPTGDLHSQAVRGWARRGATHQAELGKVAAGGEAVGHAAAGRQCHARRCEDVHVRRRRGRAGKDAQPRDARRAERQPLQLRAADAVVQPHQVERQRAPHAGALAQ